MEKRILFAFVLSIAVLYGFGIIFQPPMAPPPAPEEIVEPVESAPGDTGNEPRLVITEVDPPPEGEIRAELPESVTIDNSLYTAAVSNVGGVIQSFRLKNYTDSEGQPIELINAMAAETVGWPLALQSDDPKLDETLAAASFVIERSGNRVVFEFAANGIHAQKTIRFSDENYEIEIQSSLTRDGQPLTHDIVWQGGFGDQSLETLDVTRKNLVYASEGAYERLNVTSVTEAQQMTSAQIGVEDQYFLAMFLLPGSAPATIRAHQYIGADQEPATTLSVAVPAGDQTPLRIYVGPKDDDWLRKSDPQLASVIDWGFFEVITRPLMFALLWINGFIGNFGWSIVILTIIINFVLFPLRLKSQLSMQKMQKIQPQMKTLQDKYKKLKPKDPKRPEVQAQMMGLYKEHGINPLGGCLPLLLQMPFFLAFWNLLYVSIELRQAPWMLWITDLSQHDPTFILPIMFAGSMIVMQKLTPATMDPAQARIMMIMPVVMTVMFLWVQSGLVLYWVTGNLVGIAQQVFIKKYWSTDAEAKIKSARSVRKTKRLE